MGDGIGPEIMQACLLIMEKSGAQIQPEFVKIGEEVYNKGILTGIEDKTWEHLYKNKIFYKAPITTPQGGGFKSLNVAIRKTLGLYANVRHSCSYYPYVDTKHKDLDVVIVRENEEDLYSGVEHRQSQQVYQSLKLFSQYGCQRICQFAFEYAVAHNRKKVTCFTKDNIMKITDGLFHKMFDEVSKFYPSIKAEHWIIDIGAAKLADTPEKFDVIVTSNLYGDILSDITAQLSGSVGMSGSSNLGDGYAMFEAIHGSAPRRAGQNLANPSGLLSAGIDMLFNIGQSDVAEKIKNAWLKTLEDGIHTYDIFQKNKSQQKVGTQEFAQAIIDRLGERPQKLKACEYKRMKKIKKIDLSLEKNQRKECVGADIFFEKKTDNVPKLVSELQKINTILKLSSLKCRGLEVWPGPKTYLHLSDHWGARFFSEKHIEFKDILSLMSQMEEKGFPCIKMEGLFLFDGQPGFYLKKYNSTLDY